MARVLLFVLDSLGVGELPDAALFGDVGANTLGHICERAADFRLPNLAQLGLGKIIETPCLPADIAARGAYGKAAERSRGKDTTVGHWEMAGLISAQPLPTYPNGFPSEVIAAFEAAIGRGCIGNKAASGTAILEELGEEHLRTGLPIVYTSADSVFQIAAHEQVSPVEELYDWCRTARAILQGEHGVGRVIARPFSGQPGAFRRSSSRHDFSLEPTGVTMLDMISLYGLDCVGIGKIGDIFAGRGLTRSMPTTGNMDGVDKMLQAMAEHPSGLIFTNLVDFDMLYGHRRDVRGYATALMDFDSRLPQVMDAMAPDDLLIITADHGCDPTFRGTDHTREYVPILLAGDAIPEDYSLGTRTTFADIGMTVMEYLGCGQLPHGTAMLATTKKRRQE